MLHFLNPRNLLYYLKQQLYLYKTKQDVVFKGRALAVNTIFEGKNKVNNAFLYNAKVGYGTYLSGNSVLRNIKIGRFCSIGKNVGNTFALHPTRKFVSTHPAFFSIKRQAGFTYVNEQKYSENKFADINNKYFNIIGHDVWIGNDVKIMEGIKIGSGSIIGAGAIVTKDVPPYAIVAGIPSKIIRYRFHDDDVKWLLNFKWWEKSPEWISQNSHLFEDIKKLKSKFEI